MTVEEAVGRWAFATGLAFVVATLTSGLAAAVVLVVLVVLMSAGVAVAARGRADRLVERSLPEVLDAVAAALRTGASLPGALDELAVPRGSRSGRPGSPRGTYARGFLPDVPEGGALPAQRRASNRRGAGDRRRGRGGAAAPSTAWPPVCATGGRSLASCGRWRRRPGRRRW
jgi:hypothetical protein